MKIHTARFILRAILLLGLSLSARIQAQPFPFNDYGPAYGYGINVDIDYFDRSLAPYGRWFDHGAYGRVWRPFHMQPDWRPYTAGHWDFTHDYGWLWVSDWIWGWAPFHYGRWTFDLLYGWIWIPDMIWGPAWVFWRHGGGYAAWAPVPPEVYWRPRHGLALGHFRPDRDLPRHWWVTLPERHFSSRHLHRHVLHPRENSRIFKHTRNLPYPSYRNNRIVNHGIPLRDIERSVGRRIKPVHIREVNRLEDRTPRIRRNEVQIMRPNFKEYTAKDEKRSRKRSKRIQQERRNREPVPALERRRDSYRHPQPRPPIKDQKHRSEKRRDQYRNEPHQRQYQSQKQQSYRPAEHQRYPRQQAPLPYRNEPRQKQHKSQKQQSYRPVEHQRYPRQQAPLPYRDEPRQQPYKSQRQQSYRPVERQRNPPHRAPIPSRRDRTPVKSQQQQQRHRQSSPARSRSNAQHFRPSSRHGQPHRQGSKHRDFDH